MEALRNLVGNIPDWIRRLDDLNSQIEQRQIELAALIESQSPPGSPQNGSRSGNGNGVPRSLKNKGSTESLLRPGDGVAEAATAAADPGPSSPAPLKASPSSPVALLAAAPLAPDAQPKTGAAGAAGGITTATTALPPSNTSAPSSPIASNRPRPVASGGGPAGASALQRKMSAIKAAELAGKARARAMLRKRHRTGADDGSMTAASVENAANNNNNNNNNGSNVKGVSGVKGAPQWRTQRMIIVYYDSYVQSFFEELVKFVSASRNMMRKAKMAAKVAQIKRLAEMEMSDDEYDCDWYGNMPVIKTCPPTFTLLQPGSAPSVPLVPRGNGRTAVSPTPVPALSGTLMPDPGLTASAGMGTSGNGNSNSNSNDNSNSNATGNNNRASTTNVDEDVGVSYGWRVHSVKRSANMMMLSSGRPMHARAAKVSSPSPSPTSHSRSSSGLTTAAKGEVPTELYEDLDKGLEFVQSTSEHAAHQFLRDGDCADEVAAIEARLRETRAMAERELERIRREDPEAAAAAAAASGAGEGLELGADTEMRAGRVLRHPRMARETGSFGGKAMGYAGGVVELEVDRCDK